MEAPDSYLSVLAHRAYPGLVRSGFCSAHRESGHYACTTCYPDLNALLRAHTVVSNRLYDDLLKLSGLSDPPNGRIGTNAIVAELKRKLKCATVCEEWSALSADSLRLRCGELTAKEIRAIKAVLGAVLTSP